MLNYLIQKYITTQLNHIPQYFNRMKQLNQTSEQLKSNVQQDKYKFNPIEELQLKVNPQNKEDLQQVTKILTMILPYPSVELAQLHMDSNRLGREDLTTQLKDRDQQSDNLQYCPCCGFVKQVETVKACTHLAQINNIGISTYLYFQTIKNMIILLVLMTLIYSCYAFATNVIASGIYEAYVNNSTLSSLKSTVSYIKLSLGSKQINPTEENKNYYLIQCWIGLGLVVVWLFLFFILKYSEASQEAKVEEETISASDFTITMQNVPRDITLQVLQQHFNKYHEGITSVPANLKEQLKIAKINVGQPFYLNKQDFNDKQLEEFREQYEKIMQQFVSWIEQRQDYPEFQKSKEEREKVYNDFKQLGEKMKKKYQQIGEKVKNKIKEKTQAQVTTIFVTLESSRAMKLISELNDPSLSSRIRYYLTCCRSQNKFSLQIGEKQYDVKIERSAEPEDIIWTNLAVPFGQAIKRKIITFTVTFILLGVSFAIVYGLSQAQKSAQGNSILSLVISVSISLISIILGVVIRKLSIYEMDYTYTKYQTSFALKSIFASLINSILIPMIVNYYIKQDIYGEHGLASDVFMLGLTNSLVAPILKILDIGYIINRISKYFASKPNSRLKSNQSALNDAFQYMQFEVGSQYVYLVSLYIFTCFFVSLQPIISLFAVVGLGIMYWAQKYSLFNKMRRPVPGTNLVNIAMFQLILLGGFIYSLGSLTWSNFMPTGIPKQALLPNLVALGFGVLTFLLPYRAILALCTQESVSTNLKYSEKRLILTSEYDRLNPDTAQKAIIQFQQYCKKKIETADETEKKKMMEQFAKQNARGHQRPPPQYTQNQFGGGLFGQAPVFMPPPPQMMFMPPPPMFQPQFQFMPPPGFQQPGFQQIRVQQTGFNQPPGFQQPGFQQPGFQQPGFQQPGFQQPGFQQQGFRQPGPNFNPPGFNPNIRPPGFGQPQGFGFGQPQGFGFNMPGTNMNMNFGFGF